MKIERKNLAVYLFYIVMSICKGINLTKDSVIYIILFIGCLIMLFYKIKEEKYNIKELVRVVVLLLIGGIIYITGRNTTPLFFIIAICCLKNINIREVIKLIFYTKLVCLILMIFLTSTGILENKYLIHMRLGLGQTKRYYFGYSHPNLTQMHLLSLTIMFYYLYNKKISFTIDIISLILNYVLYKFTYSRTSLYLCIVFIIFSIISRHFPKVKKIGAYIGKHSFFILFSITMLLTISYSSSSITQKINEYLTGRIYYWNILYQNFSIPIIGKLDYESNVNIIIDNGYLGLLYQGGLLLTIYMCIVNFKISKKFYKEKKYEELIAMLFINLFCITEDFYMIPVINFISLYYSEVIFDNKKERLLNNEE